MIPSIGTVPMADRWSRFGAMATTAAARAPLVERVPAHAYFVGSAVFHYLGPAFAVLLFTRVGPLGTAWLRIAAAALLLCAWRRPWTLLRRPGLPALGAGVGGGGNWLFPP